MKIEITKATRADTPVLRQLYEFYCYDFTEFVEGDLSEAGMYADDQFLTGYWREPGWSAYIVRVGGRLAGFAWILMTTQFPDNGEPQMAAARQRLADADLLDSEHILMEEFFVMKRYRHKGIGEYVATWLFNQYDGVWEVSEIAENTPAQAFWRRIIGRYTKGNYIEITVESKSWHGPVQVFRHTST